MLIAVENTTQALQAVVQGLPVGTNFALLQLMWVMLQGRLLVSRGAILPALTGSGLSGRAARRCWSGIRYGKWTSGDLTLFGLDYYLEQSVLLRCYRPDFLSGLLTIRRSRKVEKKEKEQTNGLFETGQPAVQRPGL